MRRPLTCATLTLSLLCACSSTPTPQSTLASTLLTVPVTPGTTDAQLAERFGGVLEYRTATFAVISDARPTVLQAASLNMEKNERRVKVPHGTAYASGDKIWATGVTTWASGDKIWATGDKIWATGDKIWATSFDNFGRHLQDGWSGDFYRLFPENSDEFMGIGVRDAQLDPDYRSEPVIAVVDGPMDVTHPALAASLVSRSHWFDFVSNDTLPTAETSDQGSAAYGHATAVAGVALQVAPKSRVLPIQVLAADGSGYVLDLVKGILWAVDHGADIINLSVGTDTDSPALRAAIAYAQDSGVIVAAAAGNAANTELDYPAAYLSQNGGGVAVGSVNASSRPSSFTSTAPTPMMFAPGESIRSLYPEGREASWTGTSFSTPVVAGALAVLQSRSDTAAADVRRLFDLGDALSQVDHQSWKKLDMRHLLD